MLKIENTEIIYSETNKLRFVVRDGKKILQQHWVATRRWGPDGFSLEDPAGEWRDVSMVVQVEEEKNT